MSYGSEWRITDQQTSGNRDYTKASQKLPESTSRGTWGMDQASNHALRRPKASTIQLLIALTVQ